MPCRRGLCRGCQRDLRAPCRQDGGLGCPGGAQPHALRADTTACHGSKLMPPLFPPSLLPTRPSHHPRGRWGGGTRWLGDTGACHLLPAPAEGEEDGEGRLIALTHPLPACGRTQQERTCVSAQHSPWQEESLTWLQIPLLTREPWNRLGRERSLRSLSPWVWVKEPIKGNSAAH